jgi:hypothetical protein
VRHRNHSKGGFQVGHDRLVGISTSPVLASEWLFSIKQSTVFKSQTSICQTLFHPISTYKQQNLPKPKPTPPTHQPKYNGLRYVPTILHPLRRLHQCFHLLQKILRLKHPSSLYPRFPGLLRSPLPCICLLDGIGSSCWPPRLHQGRVLQRLARRRSRLHKELQLLHSTDRQLAHSLHKSRIRKRRPRNGD